MKLLVLIFINIFVVDVKCAKILGVFPAPGYSQFILAEVLMKEIASRGHEVTVISPYSPKKSPLNYKTIETDNVLSLHEDWNLFELNSANLFTSISTTYNYGNMITMHTLENKKVQELLKSEEQFDLVIVEHFFNDALKAFATHFKAPLILFSSMGAVEWNKECMGNPALPTINPVCYTSFRNHMSFFQRIKNIAGTVFDYLYRNYVFYPVQRKFVEKYFPNNICFDEIVNNATLMLLNSHVTTSENSLLPYNMIEIGGFHVISERLNKDIQTYLDTATEGAVLFSLGSNLKSADLSQEKLEAIFKVFRRLKQKVLWKFEKDLPNKPENLLISKWLPIKDILAHPNVKLFITHGGMLSTTESIFYGVPMVGLPVFADQAMNMARAESIGIANVIALSELSEETFFSAINKTLDDPTFQTNAKIVSKLMRDRPMKPIDLALYWIEYVIRNNGIRFEAAATKLYWFELYMLDILCFIVLNILIVFVVLRCTYNYIRNKRETDYKKKLH